MGDYKETGTSEVEKALKKMKGGKAGENSETFLQGEQSMCESKQGRRGVFPSAGWTTTGV